MNILKTIFALAAISSLSVIGVDARGAGGAKSASHFSAGGGGSAHHFGSSNRSSKSSSARSRADRKHDRVRNASHPNGKAKGNANDRHRNVSEEANTPANPDVVEQNVELPQREDGDEGDRDTGNILMGGVGTATDNEDRGGGGG